VRSYIKSGCTFEEADKTALQAAIAFRAELAEQGVVKEATGKGVTWDSHGKRWRVQMSINGQHKRASFKPRKDTFEDVERARRDAEEQRRTWEYELGLRDVCADGGVLVC